MSIKILDCTLRDGGYYTDWNFDEDLVLSTVHSAISSGIDYLELGYKSPVKGGKFRKCNDGYLKSFLPQVPDFYAFMIDLKDYISNEQVDFELLKNVIKEKDFFSVCRIAIKHRQLEFLEPVYRHIKEKGYNVIVNVMAITDLRDEEIQQCVDVISDLDIEAVYFADSYGNLKPLQIAGIVKNLRKTGKKIGFHSHDNMGLAFANSLECMNLGVDFIDCTITGMGRGVGNLKTEQLLLYAQRDISDLLKTIETYYEPLQKRMGWGFSLPYMYSSLGRVHPLIAQQINSSDLGLSNKMGLLEKFAGKMSYNEEEVRESIEDRTACVIIPARFKSSRFPGKPLALISGKEMILHVCEKAEAAVGKQHVYVATEDKRIAEVVNNAGFKFILTSDTCLTGTDRVAEASKELDYDIYVNLQGDEPLVNPKDIIAAIDLKKKNYNTVINCATKIVDPSEMESKSVPKMVFSDNDNLLYVSRSPVPGSKKEEVCGFKQVCIYCFNSKELEIFTSDEKTSNEFLEDIEILRFLEKEIPVKVLKLENASIAVDYPEDIRKVEKCLI